MVEVADGLVIVRVESVVVIRRGEAKMEEKVGVEVEVTAGG